MKKRIIFLVVMLLIILAVVILFLYKNKITTQNTDTVQNKSENQQVAFSILDDKDFVSSNAIESYKIGTIEFKIYPGIDPINAPGYFEVYENGKKVFGSQPNHKVWGLLSFAFSENKYVVVKDYSGGAHCCDMDYLFRINQAGQVKLLKIFDMGNVSIEKENLLFKNNKLYFVLTDDSFQYFHTAFANSYFFQQYYQLDGDNIILANKDFAADITKTAEDCKAKITTDPAQPDDEGNYWLNDVVCYITNYTLIGEQATALNDFNGFFNKFFPSGSGKDAFGETITRDKLKQEIVDVLKNDRFK